MTASRLRRGSTKKRSCRDAELRRIERDLHDGAQARLVALGMSLGLAEQKFAADPEGARVLVAEARHGIGEALPPETAILVVSQYVEHTYATELLAEAGAGGVGYLLKDRVLDVSDFVDAVRRVASGGTALDPGGSLTPREREVLELMAEGRSNAAIASSLVLTVGAVEKHNASIFQKLRLAPPTPTTAACSPCWSTSGASAPARLGVRGATAGGVS